MEEELEDEMEVERPVEEEDADIASEDDSSDSEDSEKEREEHNALERRVVEIRKELSKTPTAYDLHVELIKSLRKLGELDQLRHARECMHAIYPLTEELWLDWLHDEIKLGTTLEDQEKTEQLFIRASKDYLSIDIWMEYIQFSLTGMEAAGPEGIKKIRSVMEEAVRHGGLHAVKGALLWDSYRDFEMVIYHTTKTNETESAAQIQLITQQFNRQLTVPLLDMERTWNEYNEWLQALNKEVEPHVKASYEKAKGQLEKIAPLEEKLLTAVENAEKAAAYRPYLDLELYEFKDPARIQALFERIMAEMPLFDTFWIEYCRYVDRSLNAGEAALALYCRAVRNCPWNSTLWADYVFAAERYKKDRAYISGLVEKAFSAGLVSMADIKAVWMAFIEYLVRHCSWDNEDQVKLVRDAFVRATEHLAQYAEIEVDSDCALLQYWAYIETKKLNNLAKGREIWGQIMRSGHKKLAQWWLLHIQFERTFGDDPSIVRKLFSQSMNSVASTDWPESIVLQWIQFEREEGDFETMETARSKCEARMKKVAIERAKQPADEEPPKGRKRTKEDDSKEKKSPAAKKARPETDAFKGKPKIARAAQPETVVVAVPKPPEDPQRHARTVFVSNLKFDTTEDDIRAAMQRWGTITDLRLIRDYKQRSKGYCYVEFSTEEEAKLALTGDREPLNGRPMFISPSEANAALKHPVFKYQTTVERKKLFVKGLPTTATKEDVEKLFSEYGIVKEARLVTFKSGLPKGIAYVEFEDESSAQLALRKIDGSTYQERQLTVAISNPPPRRDLKPEKDEAMLGGGSRQRRTQVSFVPNAVLRKTQPSSMPPPPPGAAKSNADFRSMLLNNK